MIQPGVIVTVYIGLF